MASSSIIIISLGILLALCFDSSRLESVLGAPENKGRYLYSNCCIREKRLAQDQQGTRYRSRE
jgi:hypothetical protein